MVSNSDKINEETPVRDFVNSLPRERELFIKIEQGNRGFDDEVHFMKKIAHYEISRTGSVEQELTRAALAAREARILNRLGLAKNGPGFPLKDEVSIDIYFACDLQRISMKFVGLLSREAVERSMSLAETTPEKMDSHILDQRAGDYISIAMNILAGSKSLGCYIYRQ